MNKYFSILVVSFLIQGCSVMPYQEESQCNYQDFGKCLSIDKAYKEATTGISQGGELVNGENEVLTDNTIFDLNSKQINTDKEDYESILYQKQKSLIKKASMPLLNPAVVRRILVMSYKNQDSDVWYEPRHIYYIEKQPTWSLEKIKLNNDRQNIINLYK
jgi:hypothetical protein